jgi:hypothetical protein
MKLIISIKISSVQGLQIDKNDNIFVSSNDRFCIYDLKGELFKSCN